MSQVLSLPPAIRCLEIIKHIVYTAYRLKENILKTNPPKESRFTRIPMSIPNPTVEIGAKGSVKEEAKAKLCYVHTLFSF